jgi:hypothetical protein
MGQRAGQRILKKVACTHSASVLERTQQVVLDGAVKEVTVVTVGAQVILLMQFQIRIMRMLQINITKDHSWIEYTD